MKKLYVIALAFVLVGWAAVVFAAPPNPGSAPPGPGARHRGPIRITGLEPSST